VTALQGACGVHTPLIYDAGVPMVPSLVWNVATSDIVLFVAAPFLLMIATLCRSQLSETTSLVRHTLAHHHWLPPPPRDVKPSLLQRRLSPVAGRAQLS
jgi:hypothetical protein